MAAWRSLAILSVGALALGGCGSSSGDDDDGGAGSAGESGTGGTGGTGGGGTGAEPCGTLTSEEASRIASDNIAAVLHASVETTRFLEASVLVQKLLGRGPEAEEPFVFADDANESIDEMVDTLRTDVLVDANVETSTDNAVTYHLTPEVNCPLDEEYFEIDPEGATLEQEECTADLVAHPVRYTVSRVECDHGDAVRIVLEVGEARIVPGALTAAPSMLTLRLDVAETVRAVKDDDPTAVFDADSSGSIVATLMSGYGISNLTFALETDVVLGALEAEEPWRVVAEASPYAVALNASSESTHLAGGLRLGTLDATVPLATFVSALGLELGPDVPTTDTVDLHVPRLSAGVDFDAFVERLALFDTDLPTVSVNRGDDRLFSLDINKEADWALSAVVELDEDGLVSASANPGFTLDLAFGLAPLENQLVDPPPFMLEDHVSFALSGDAPSVTLLDDADGGLLLTARTEGPVVRVDAGSLVLSSELAESEGATVDEGQCLLFDPTLEGEHDLLRGYYADECP
jgi:hypothetical protein